MIITLRKKDIEKIAGKVENTGKLQFFLFDQ